uniref:Uncharacterized protein n=1 Tax=Eutreptiella gymnastica TaxID=73025 RepID=A0A7S1NBS9_9EUGL
MGSGMRPRGEFAKLSRLLERQFKIAQLRTAEMALKPIHHGTRSVYNHTIPHTLDVNFEQGGGAMMTATTSGRLLRPKRLITRQNASLAFQAEICLAAGTQWSYQGGPHIGLKILCLWVLWVSERL